MATNRCGKRGAVLRIWLDYERIPEGGFRKLALAGRPSEAMRGKRRLPVGIRRDLAVVDHVIIGTGHDADAVPVRVVGEFPEVRNQLLGVRHVQLAVGLHEVVLGVHVPEDDAGGSYGHQNALLKEGAATGESLRGPPGVSTDAQ